MGETALPVEMFVQKTKKPSKAKTVQFKTASEFESLSDIEKERIYRELDGQSTDELLAQSTPLNAKHRERQRKFPLKGKGGRPKFGKHGVKVIALSVERDLLARADAYAKTRGLKRAELFTKAILKLLPKAG
ncbi:MAG TPA: hypothetical protein VG326_09710 [Tepidisphaeraceae bacterium]|jgi:hypothetical protein|nr:hypothetical protein [Tepidisphaeraceae bacterium]